MTKRLILAALTALLAVAIATAQQISVVTEGGETTLYSTLADAINGAEPGSVIYLPGGGFPIADSVKITKKLTIIGIGHRSDNDNVDGCTSIAGNVFFNGGSDGSAILGCYISGSVCIGYDDVSVNNILIKYCNASSVSSRANCENITVSQNYLRNTSSIRGCYSIVKNNVLHSLLEMNSSTICNNIVRNYITMGAYHSCFWSVSNSIISNNIIIEPGSDGPGRFCSNNQVNHNMFINRNWGDNCVTLTGCTWNDVFVNYNGGAISPMSDFHFTEDYQQYSECGIYGGTGFNDHQTAPVPYIVSKTVDEQTNSAGFLNITITVKAGE